MSVKVMSLVFEHYHGQGGERCLALALADCANDSGASIWPGIERMARYSRQSERSVQRQLRAMEASGWLECTKPSVGGKGRPNEYRINPRWIADPVRWRPNGDILSPLAQVDIPPETVTSATANGDTAMSPEQHQNLKTFPPLSPHNDDQPGGAVPSDGSSDEALDRQLAEWMFGLVLALHPQHQPPNWRRWCREIRLLRDRDKRTRKEIAGLFRWANNDPFWQLNIRSPGKLRAKWDDLVIRRKATGWSPAGGDSADYRCVQHPDRQARRSIPGVGWCCLACITAHEEAAVHG